MSLREVDVPFAYQNDGRFTLVCTTRHYATDFQLESWHEEMTNASTISTAEWLMHHVMYCAILWLCDEEQDIFQSEQGSRN